MNLYAEFLHWVFPFRDDFPGRHYPESNHPFCSECGCSVSKTYGGAMSDDIVRLTGENATVEKEDFLFIHNVHAQRLVKMSVAEKYELKLRLEKAIRHLRMLTFSTDIILREDMREMAAEEREELRKKDAKYKPRLVVNEPKAQKPRSERGEKILAWMTEGYSKAQAEILFDLTKAGFSDEDAKDTVGEKKVG